MNNSISLTSVILLLLLQGCVTAPQTQSLFQQPTSLPALHEVADVPFYPQEEYYCGPTTLAEILSFYGTPIDPEQVAASLFIPEKRGSLQIEMVAAARQHDLLAYAEKGNLVQLLSLVGEGKPVIVFQNLGTSWYPFWHYAVVIGYDLNTQSIILHTGVTQRRVLRIDLFENSWRKGDYWMLAAVPPDQSSEHFDPFVYVSAAQDLAEVGQTLSAVEAFTTATSQWPDYWLSYFLLGNYYLQGQPQQSLEWFEKGLDSAAGNSSYLNNYAYSLHYNDRSNEAVSVIQRALRLDPGNERLQDSLNEISDKVANDAL
jgi:tetratricopeptide (TPR) repeat protein